MLTRCPNCKTIYRLGATDLAAAQGFVECGECGEQFCALDRIADEPSSSPGSPEPDIDADASDLASILLDPGDSTGSDESVDESEAVTFVSVDSPALDREPAAVFDPSPPIEIEIPRGPASQRLSDREHAILFTDPSVAYEDEAGGEITSFDIDDVPTFLQGEVAALGRPPRRSSGRLWTSFGFVLIAGLALQLAWVFRDRIVAALPSAQPVYLAACERLGCRFDPAVAPEAIALISRDVRDHPQYRETLLVNATLISRANTPTAFPIIQFGLYAQTGEAIGIRRFAPQEYLDKSIELAAGMPPNRPVYIVMEISSMGGYAVSFEFAFL